MQGIIATVHNHLELSNIYWIRFLEGSLCCCYAFIVLTYTMKLFMAFEIDTVSVGCFFYDRFCSIHNKSNKPIIVLLLRVLYHMNEVVSCFNYSFSSSIVFCFYVSKIKEIVEFFGSLLSDILYAKEVRVERDEGNTYY